MQKILQALHGSPGFVELARGKLIRPLTEEEQQRGEHLFRRAMVDEFGPELARMIC